MSEVRTSSGLIIFYVNPNPNQLSALTVLANHYRPRYENVMIPFSSGCQSFFFFPTLNLRRKTPEQ